ncbi:MAG: carboxypeptidase regulatory-like domain-containing protein [Bryobacterales bacterium]|nr:carboxypeptidase regulatory-like domain-containing protein [Bryobacterales bacterium]MBV9398689.1 carboxypeptidase regulatory-like domain-containing protein [Bryobacterales bacterium]
MSRRHFVLIAGTAALRLPLFGQQTAVVTGTITRRNGDPAINVTVSVGSRHELTDVRGKYRIAGVPYGNQKLQITEGKRVLHQTTLDIRQPAIQFNQRLP